MKIIYKTPRYHVRLDSGKSVSFLVTYSPAVSNVQEDIELVKDGLDYELIIRDNNLFKTLHGCIKDLSRAKTIHDKL